MCCMQRLCTSLTFKGGFSLGPYLTELSIYLFRNGKITVLTQRFLSSTAARSSLMCIDVCLVVNTVKKHVCAEMFPFFKFEHLSFNEILLPVLQLGHLPLITVLSNLRLTWWKSLQQM